MSGPGPNTTFAEPLRVLIMVAHAAGSKGRRGAGGPEVRTLHTLGFWDPARIKPMIAYSSAGQLIDLAKNAQAYYDVSFTGGAVAGNFKRLVKVLGDSRARVVHSYGPIAADFLTVAAAKRAKVATVVTRPVVLEDLQEPWWIKTTLGIMDRYTLLKVDRMVAISEHGRESLIDSGCRADKLTVIHNGIDTRRFSPAVEPDRELSVWAGDSLLIAMCAQMTPVKRHDHLLRAVAMGLAQGRDWRVVLAGDGPRREELTALAGELGLGERVRFAGFVSDTPALYRACDVVVLPSEREGFPMALLEAMSCGVPVAASNAGGTAELIKGGGLLLTNNTVEELHQALVELENPARRKELGAAGRAKVEDHFAIERMIGSLSDLYRDAATGNLSPHLS